MWDFRAKGAGMQDQDPPYQTLPPLVTSPRTEISSRAGRGETLHMKGVGMLIVSLRGVNFRFWSHLVCSGQNAIIFSREGLV